MSILLSPLCRSCIVQALLDPGYFCGGLNASLADTPSLLRPFNFSWCNGGEDTMQVWFTSESRAKRNASAEIKVQHSPSMNRLGSPTRCTGSGRLEAPRSAQGSTAPFCAYPTRASSCRRKRTSSSTMRAAHTIKAGSHVSPPPPHPAPPTPLPIHPPSHPLPRAQTPNSPLLPRPQTP